MRFVTLIRFTQQGVAKIGETTRRAHQFRERTESLGIKIHELLWTQGNHDGLILFEAADIETAAAAMLGLASQCNVQTETMVAFDSAAMERLLAKLK
jgi:uncharacterized protein with GYD domain